MIDGGLINCHDESERTIVIYDILRQLSCSTLKSVFFLILRILGSSVV